MDTTYVAIQSDLTMGPAGPAGLAAFNLFAKSGTFNVSDGPGAYYRSTGSSIAMLPASPADGSVRKFKAVSGTLTFVFDESETLNHADGTSDQSMVLTPGLGVLELTAVVGGWDET